MVEGVLSPFHAPNVALTASSIGDGAPVWVCGLNSVAEISQRWTIKNGVIALASNPCLVIGPGIASPHQLILHDVSKTDRKITHDLTWKSSASDVKLDGSLFDRMPLFNEGKSLLLETKGAANRTGEKHATLCDAITAESQMWSFRCASQNTPRITLYSEENLRGNALVLEKDEPNVSSLGFQNKVLSLHVEHGTWLLHYAPNYEPSICNYWIVSSTGGKDSNGKYQLSAEWGDWNGGVGIQSLRPIPQRGIVLYEHEWFGGRSAHLISNTANFSSFNNVRSIIVVTGTWRIFSNPEFKGRSFTVYPSGGYCGRGYYCESVNWGGVGNLVNSLTFENL